MEQNPAFEKRRLKKLRKILNCELGLQLDEDDLQAAAVSILRFTIAKLLRARKFQSRQEDNNAGNEQQSKTN